MFLVSVSVTKEKLAVTCCLVLNLCASKKLVLLFFAFKAFCNVINDNLSDDYRLFFYH